MSCAPFGEVTCIDGIAVTENQSLLIPPPPMIICSHFYSSEVTEVEYRCYKHDNIILWSLYLCLVVKRFQSYVDPEEPAIPVSGEEEGVALPLGDSTLICNLGVPIIVVCCKVGQSRVQCTSVFRYPLLPYSPPSFLQSSSCSCLLLSPIQSQIWKRHTVTGMNILTMFNKPLESSA